MALLVGCSSVTTTPHPTLHPSLDDDANAAGISAGLVYGTIAETDTDVDSSVLSVPYGEGWARFATGPGQLELRMGPSIGFVSYRLNVLRQEDEASGGVGLAFLPSFGIGAVSVSTTTTSSMGTTSSTDTGFISLIPGLGGLLSIGGFYVAPRFGFTHLIQIGDTDPGDDTTQNLISLAVNIGYTLEGDPFDVSLELAFMRVTSTEDESDGAFYVIVPTVGIQL